MEKAKENNYSLTTEKKQNDDNTFLLKLFVQENIEYKIYSFYGKNKSKKMGQRVMFSCIVIMTAKKEKYNDNNDIDNNKNNIIIENYSNKNNEQNNDEEGHVEMEIKENICLIQGAFFLKYISFNFFKTLYSKYKIKLFHDGNLPLELGIICKICKYINVM